MTERIKRARAAVDTAVGKRKVIEYQLDHATAGIDAAKCAYSQTVKGELRVSDLIRIINVCYGGELKQRELASPFARVLLSAAMWARTAMPGNKAARLRSSIEFVAKVLPIFPIDELDEIGRHLCRYTNAEAAVVLGVTWDMHCTLGLRMIGACDLSDYEFKHRKREQRKVRDRIRKQAKAKAEGKRSIDELREQRKKKSEAIKVFADANGVSEKTVRNWLTSGKVRRDEQRENEFRTSTLIYAETTFPTRGVRASSPRKPLHVNLPAAMGNELQKSRFKQPSVLFTLEAIARSMPGAVDRVCANTAEALRRGAASRAGGPLRAPRKAVGS